MFSFAELFKYINLNTGPSYLFVILYQWKMIFIHKFLWFSEVMFMHGTCDYKVIYVAETKGQKE